jgi:hypothetical protein
LNNSFDLLEDLLPKKMVSLIFLGVALLHCGRVTLLIEIAIHDAAVLQFACGGFGMTACGHTADLRRDKRRPKNSAPLR